MGVEKLIGIDWADVVKVDGIDAADVVSVMGLTATPPVLALPSTFTGGIYANTDDGYGYAFGGNNWLTSQSDIPMGKPYGIIGYEPVFCFKNTIIPPGATITSAVITVFGQGSGSGDCSVLVKIAEADSQAIPTNGTEWAAISWYGSSVQWDITAAWSANVEYSSPDISTLLQAIINRGGWALDNNIVIGLSDNGSTNGQGRVVKGRNAASLWCARLDVTYTHPTFCCLEPVGRDAVGHWQPGGSFANYGNELIATDASRNFHCYDNCGIPQGTTLASAKIRHLRISGANNGVTVRINCDDADNASYPANATQGDALSLTTAYTDWATGSTFTKAWVETADFHPAVEEVLARPGFTPGNNLQVIWSCIVGNGYPYDYYGYNDEGTTNENYEGRWVRPKLLISLV